MTKKEQKALVRRKTTKLRKILHSGYFVNLPIEFPTYLEGQIRLWRAVLDQHLKDLITHHLVEKNFNNYYEAIRFFHEQETQEKGQEFALACVPNEKVTRVFNGIENVCRQLREKGVKI